MNTRFGDVRIRRYYEENNDSVYSNQYGKANQLYYLFTNDAKLHRENIPTDTSFHTTTR